MREGRVLVLCELLTTLQECSAALFSRGLYMVVVPVKSVGKSSYIKYKRSNTCQLPDAPHLSNRIVSGSQFLGAGSCPGGGAWTSYYLT